MASIGWRYDLRNVMDLARYLIPVRIVPARLRNAALHFGSSVPTEVICSSLIAQLFHRVRFPILPKVEFPAGPLGHAPQRRRRGLMGRILGYESDQFTGLFRMRHPTLITPRDFDLSPYFEVIKFNVVANGAFDYQSIHWAADGLDEVVEAAAADGPPRAGEEQEDA